jgi:predicted transcriptional regulator
MLAALAMADRPLADDAAGLVARLEAGAVDRRIDELRRGLAEAERAPGRGSSALLEELIALEHRRRDLRSPA